MNISVIIPAHNEEKFIQRALNSLLLQDLPPSEIIVVDNASSDQTAYIVKQNTRRHSRIRLISETQKGILFAREAGRLAAQGEIIASMDADCEPKPDWILRGSRHFKNPEVVAVSGPYDYHDTNTFFRVTVNIIQLVFSPIVQRINGFAFIGGNYFVRASALSAMGGYNTSILFDGEDMDTAMRLARIGIVAFDPQLIQPTSGRRFEKLGVCKTVGNWIVAFWHLLSTLRKKGSNDANRYRD